MTNLFITQYSIGFISPAVLSLLISCAIILKQFKNRKFTPDRVSLSCYFAGAAGYNLLNFFGFSIYSPSAQIVWYLESFAPFVILFLVRFAYYYPAVWHPKERKIVLAAGSLLAAAATAEYWINSWNSPVSLFGHNFGAEYFSSAIPLLNAAFYLWSATVFLRRAAYFERGANPQVRLHRIILSPTTREARISRTFACLILADVSHSFIVYGQMNAVSVSISSISFYSTVIMLIILSLYTIVYLHYAYDNIPFIFKLTGIPLLITLIIVTASGYMIMNYRSIAFDEMNHAMISGFSLDKNRIASEEDSPVSYIAVRENDQWKIVYDREGSLPGTVESRFWKESPSGHQFKSGRGSVSDMNIDHEGRYFLQINGTNYNQYNRKIGGTTYGFGIPYRNFLIYMHNTGCQIFAAMIFVIILILTFLPVLYHFGIITPLRKAIRGGLEKGESISSMENELYLIEKIISKPGKLKKNSTLPGKPEEISPALKDRLDKITAYLDKNYHEDISREGLASMVGLDPDYISRLFKIYTGTRIGDYINMLRVEEASRLLAEGNKSVIEISMAVGFESLRTFNRAFIKITGKTPTEYRNKNS